MTEGVSATMQDLTPVGLSKDGSKLVLVSSSGEEFAVAVDQRLRTALRGDNARLGQLEMKMESALRPRDIQTRIRAGESPEAVAAAAQTTVDAIMAFAAPVLAERAHVAQLAQGSSVRRRQGEPPTGHRTLGEAAAAYFSGLDTRADDVEWDAWRRDDGRWTLVANYGAGAAQQQAQFSFDQRGRYVTADNDEARMLVGELSRPEPKTASPATGRRLSAVPSDDELPLGDDDLGSDAIELVREPESEPESEPEPESQPEAATSDEETTDLGDAAAAVREESEQPPKGKGRRKGRSSVPSWDEIMFGGGKQD
jgi:hypothetical protein